MLWPTLALLSLVWHLFGAQGVALSSYCANVRDSCSCEAEGNEVVIRCPYEYTMVLEVMDNIKLHISYFNFTDFGNVPKLYIRYVSKLDIDAYSYWNRTFLTDLLEVLAVGEVHTLEFRDRVNVTSGEKWEFGEINALRDFTFYTDKKELNVCTFNAYTKLEGLKLMLDVEELPDQLLWNLPHLRTLFINNERSLYFRDVLMHNLTHLNEFTLNIKENKLNHLYPQLFMNMPQLTIVRIINAVNQLPPDFFLRAYNLTQIQIINNENLVSLPSALLYDQSQLVTLDLHSNDIRSLPIKFFKSLQRLENLDLSSNKITFLSNVHFAPLERLRFVKLNNNPLTLIDPTSFAQIRTLHTVEICGSQFYGTRLIMPSEALLCTNDETCRYRAEPWVCPPNCFCWVERSSSQLIIECSSGQAEVFPNLPSTKLLDTVFKFVNNSIKTLPDRHEPGYANVSALHLKHNLLTTIEIEQLPQILTYIDVSSNRLRGLSSDFIEYLLEEKPSLQLGLADNPLDCDCGALPLLRFVRSQPHRIRDLAEVRCASPKFAKSFQQLDKTDICPSNLLVIVGVVGGVCVIVCLLVMVCIMYAQPIKIWLYNNNLCLCWVSQEELDKDKLFDAFISYSHKDEDLIAIMMPVLEGGAHPFRLCLHERDWLVGDCIPERIVRTVSESKRIIIILSQHFLDSVWARMEFRIAYQATLEDKRKRIIVILYRDIDMNGLSSELKAYLKLNTYLKWSDPNFWSKLRYAMPHNKRVLKGQKRWNECA